MTPIVVLSTQIIITNIIKCSDKRKSKIDKISLDIVCSD